MKRDIIIEIIKSCLNPNFHVSFGDDGIDILSPNKTLGVKVIIGKCTPKDIACVGRMMAHSFANKAWEIL